MRRHFTLTQIFHELLYFVVGFVCRQRYTELVVAGIDHIEGCRAGPRCLISFLRKISGFLPGGHAERPPLI